MCNIFLSIKNREITSNYKYCNCRVFLALSNSIQLCSKSKILSLDSSRLRYKDSSCDPYSPIFAFNAKSMFLCSHCFRFFQVKRAALHEMVEYVTTNRNVLTESTYPEVNIPHSTHFTYCTVPILHTVQRPF